MGEFFTYQKAESYITHVDKGQSYVCTEGACTAGGISHLWHRLSPVRRRPQV